MLISVLIPSHARAAKLAVCLGALARQTLPAAEYEVLVGLDGPDAAAESAAHEAWADAGGGHKALTVLSCAKAGQAAVRNQLLLRARGRFLVFLNDDLIPHAGLLATHARHQQAQSRPALIIGDAPWRRYEPDRLFDRLLRETSMVFFYNVMRADPDPGRDWGFRHAWMLNLSAPTDAVRAVGGLTVFPSTYGFEDDDLAFRLARRFGCPVLYRPDAVALHDHRMDPADYLARERRLGFAAYGFALVAPECARAMFGREVSSDEELDYSRAFVAREAAAAARLEASFLGLAGIPAGSIPASPAPHADRLINLIYEQHLLLKRFHWRTGLVEAATTPTPTPRAPLRAPVRA
jgi:GT2 family glycosyltransferase